MWPDSPFAEARGSFQTPVPLPVVDPDASPTISVTVSCQWLPFIRGALQQLLLETTWKTDDPDALNLVQSRAWNLINLFQECASADIPFACEADFRDSASPFATINVWTPDGLGVYVPLAGYQNTIASVGPSTYSGVVIEVKLDSPVTLSNVSVLYDLSHGSVNDPSEQALAVYNLPSGTPYGTPVPFSGLVDGSSLVYNTGPAAGTHDHFIVRLFAASSGSLTPPTIPGLCYIRGLIITGSAPDYDCG